ncbi:uncharacterized protein BXZ73DRAFT_106964 [Epithele typhae]|uniref:uncharacterized protein n=1 Tax=Epithele typhae TaxID=378194 RepID=UPI002007BF80|nr:uncharacterized protein BXZ73DRAFT_106964 [Epithele typhae]KAH9913316.1 hypothetical protein BXZ73DRAFT_106964 [Epithele typhae]
MLDGFEDTEREIELRLHIHSLLDQYFLDHGLTKDYIEWSTEQVIDILSEGLKSIPMTASTNIALPRDPFEILWNQLQLGKLEPYSPRWVINDRNTISLIRRCLSLVPKKVSESYLYKDDHDVHDSPHPLSPVLTWKSMRETPRPGKNTYPGKSVNNLQEVLQTYNISRVDDVAMEDIYVREEDALGYKLQIDSKECARIMSLMKSIPLMKRQQSEPHVPQAMQDFLRADSPVPLAPESLELPIFSRNDPGRSILKEDPGDRRLSTFLESIPGLSKLWPRPVEIMEEEEDMANAHLAVLDALHPFKLPSSPFTLGTPSLSNDSDEHEGAMIPSSPKHVLDRPFSPMETVIFPRSETIGGTIRPHTPVFGDGKLSSFVSQYIKAVPMGCEANIVLSPKLRSSSPPITLSMLGQPPTEAEVLPAADDAQNPATGRREIRILNSDDTDDFILKAVEKACGGPLSDYDPFRPILEEKLDETESIFMDVPRMRDPTEYPREQLLPTTLHDLVSLKPQLANVEEQESKPGFHFLKKAKGLSALNLSLSWTPFKYRNTVPTQEDITGLTERDLTEKLANKIELPRDEIAARVSALLDDLAIQDTLPGMDLVPSSTALRGDHASDEVPSKIYVTSQEPEFILPRSDQRRLAGMSIEEDWDWEGSDTQDTTSPEESSFTQPPLKRVYGWDPTYQLESGIVVSEQTLGDERTVLMRTINDSGNFEADNIRCPPLLDIDWLDPYYGLGVSPQHNSVYTEVLRSHAAPMLSSVLPDGDETSPSQPSEDGVIDVISSFDNTLPPHPINLIEAHALDSVNTQPQIIDPSSAIGDAVPLDSLQQFLALFGKVVQVEEAPSSELDQPYQRQHQSLPLSHWLSDDYVPPDTIHRYMASMDFIQRRALVRALRAYCAVELIERERLGVSSSPNAATTPNNSDDAHLILDVDAAVLFVPLELLPARGAALAELLARLSWRYLCQLVILQCYPSSHDIRGDSSLDSSAAQANIAEGMDTKRAGSAVVYAFAASVEEAAACARAYGDITHAEAHGAVRCPREWLTHEERDGEDELSSVDGMNLFAASLLLSQTTLEKLLETSPDERLVEYSDLVGADRMKTFNEYIARRLEVIELPPSSPPPEDVKPDSSSDRSTSLFGEGDHSAEC